MATSSPAELWATLAAEAEQESRLWADALRPDGEREEEPIFSPLGEARFGLAVETIYEGYLAHYGRPRLFAPPDADTALLLGDYLYAHGLVRVAAAGDVEAVGDLAGLISVCAQLRADGRDGDGAAWAATTALLGGDGPLAEALQQLSVHGNSGPLDELSRAAAGDEAVERAVAAHARRLR